jgi:uridine kinase
MNEQLAGHDAADVGRAVAGITALLREDRPVVVGIDGFGGSGKSTLAVALATELRDAEVVALDDFILKQRMLDDSWEHGWDRDRLRRQVLDPLLAGGAGGYERFEWETETLSQLVPVGAAAFVIVEGITTLHPELRRYWDYGIWVETPVAVARERGRARDAGNENESHWDLWSRNDVRYLEDSHPDLAADVIIRND